MSERLRAAAKLLWTVYCALAFLIGSAAVLTFLGILIAVNIRHEPQVRSEYVPMSTGNGFVFARAPDAGEAERYVLTDEQGQVVVPPDVIDFLVCGSTIYGYRRDSAGRPGYFMCDSGRDCRDRLNLSDAQLRHLVRERELPLFAWNLHWVSRSFFLRNRDFERGYSRCTRAPSAGFSDE